MKRYSFYMRFNMESCKRSKLAEKYWAFRFFFCFVFDINENAREYDFTNMHFRLIV